ncbi:hypothetical protein [Dyadobacter sp. Leaf189]|uniref:hypothetical protein n=1 Tax=Dyadobacter sp. Leaf189 TaxID=1736295 RepID=UPI0006FEFAEC|nr:hypothetical protein [Dyadobacter sp. Leaf189]KQS34060.1 hypothetical protein ASG33_08565 [Dyadobacter sp. Leaf189]
MEVAKSRGKPDLEVLLSAALVTLINFFVLGIPLRSFGLLVSPALAFYAAMLINDKSDSIKLRNQQKVFESNLADQIKMLENEKSCCCETDRKKEIEDELRRYPKMRFESNIEKLQSVKPDYKRLIKTKKII